VISFLGRLRGRYSRYERFLPVFTFSAGFIWDSLTLTRIDRLSDSLILLGYIIGLGIMIVVVLRRQWGASLPRWAGRLEPHFLWAIQFLLGGLFSSYVVFYFKSTSWSQTQYFFLLLVILLVGNEFLHHRLGNATLLAILFTFCMIAFLSFFLPVMLADVSTRMFLVAGLISVTSAFLVFSLGLLRNTAGALRRMKPVSISILGTYAAVTLFYFANMIPPVPIALKDAGIYHGVRRTASGYEVQYIPSRRGLFAKSWDDPFYLGTGDAVYCYAAVFAPRGIRVPVTHVWSMYSRAEGWVRKARVAFEIHGGREGGYRGFSMKRAVVPGDWRVEVETEEGRLIGRIDFRVVTSPQPRPPLVSRTIN
jgi:hypothetical protein